MHHRERVNTELLRRPADVVPRARQLRHRLYRLLPADVQRLHELLPAAAHAREVARPAFAAVQPWRPLQLALVGHVLGVVEPLDARARGYGGVGGEGEGGGGVVCVYQRGTLVVEEGEESVCGKR